MSIFSIHSFSGNSGKKTSNSFLLLTHKVFLIGKDHIYVADISQWPTQLVSPEPQVKHHSENLETDCSLLQVCTRFTLQRQQSRATCIGKPGDKSKFLILRILVSWVQPIVLLQSNSLPCFSHLLRGRTCVLIYFAYTITHQEHLVPRPSGEPIMEDYGLNWPKMSLENTTALVQERETTAAGAKDKGVREGQCKS